MNFDIGTFLITLCAALAVLAVYRFLDRNNRSLEKVRKYAEKLKDDLGLFVEQRHVVLKDYAIELDVRQKAAKEVLLRVKEIEDGLNSRAQALDAVGKRITEYDSVLDELMGMTERADENLKRIKEESEFADTVAKKLEAAEAKLESVMKGLPAVQAEFARANDENFKRYAHEMRANLERTLRATAEQAEEASKRSLAARNEIAAADKLRADRAREDLAAIEASFEGAFERARRESEKLGDSAFGKLKDSILGRADKLQDAMEEKFQSLQAMAKERIQETQVLVKEHKAECAAQAKAMGEKAMADLEARAKAQREAIVSEFTLMSEDLERSLAEAKKEADYRFDALSAVNVDIERLDAALRGSMAEIKAGIERDLDAAGKALGERQQEQEKRLSQNMSELQAVMGELERGVNELKSKAYENVSEKLKLFEDDFFADLKKRSEDTDRALGEWRTGVETRISSLSDADEEERARIEKSYLEDLRKLSGDFQARLDEQMGRLEERMSAYEASIGTRMENSDRSLESFHDGLRKNAEEQRKQAQAAIEAEFSRHELATAEQLKKSERELSAWRDSISKSLDELESKAGARRDALSKELSSIGAEVTRLSKEVPKQAAQAMEAFNAEYQALLADTRAQADEIKSRVESSETRLMGKISEDAKALSASLDDLDRREKAIAAQAKTFERADELKQKLEEELEDLKAGIAKTQTFRAEIGELEAQVTKVKRLEEETSQKMARFIAERRRIDAMEEDFRKLLSISQAVDSKLESVTASHDGLTEMEARLRKLSDLSNEAEGKYERLEKKSNVLDATIEGIDRNFQSLQDIEKAVRRHDEELREMPERLIEVKRSLEAVMEGSGRVDKAVQRLETLDGTLKDIEGRIAAMQKAREWLAGTETRLQELAKEAQEQVKLFGDIMKSETSGARKQSGAPAMGTRETVAKLARQGWTVEEIARATKLSRGEIELILEMSPKR